MKRQTPAQTQATRKWFGVYYTYNNPGVWHISGYKRVWTTDRKRAKALVIRTLAMRETAVEITDLRFARCTPAWWLRNGN